MDCSLKTNFCVLGPKTKEANGICPSIRSLQFAESKSKFLGISLNLSDQKGFREQSVKPSNNLSVQAQASICVSRSMRWWEKTLKPNMIEIHSAQELVHSLSNAGDKLVIVDFYSPGCGGCKALHPKICQLAESNPKAIILKVNYEELKPMCHSLHIHVLPFFRFYRGAEGKLCSFSCTVATIKKFKDALAKHGTERCNLGPAKGLEESELMGLASIGQIPKILPLPNSKEERLEELVMKGLHMSNTLSNNIRLQEESSMVIARV